ncbi:MAG: DUF3343 domain-containing protein [Clostridia bacterium]|nr:DUF3343 domain-containing protein [Clostridia bacterium]
MKKITVTVGSVTYAIKLRKLLVKNGIGCRLVKLDNTVDGKGCTHGVEIFEGDLYRTVFILRENGIAYKLKD